MILLVDQQLVQLWRREQESKLSTLVVQCWGCIQSGKLAESLTESITGTFSVVFIETTKT